MNHPALKLALFAVISFLQILSVEAWAWDPAPAYRAAGCNGGNVSSYRCQAVESFYKGANGLALGAGSCQKNRVTAEECCGAPVGSSVSGSASTGGTWRPSDKCKGMLDDRGKANLATTMSPPPATGSPPTNGASDVFGTITADRTKNEAGRNSADSLAGLCQAARAACMETCDMASNTPDAAAGDLANDVNKRGCATRLKDFADGFQDQAKNFEDAVKQNIQAGQGTGTPGSGTPGSGTPGGSSPGGNQSGNTQKPQSQGGNPMGDMMKALSGLMNQQQQPEQQQQQAQQPQDCSSNPALAGCPTQVAGEQKSDSWNKKTDGAEMKDPESGSKDNNFNVASSEAGDTSYNGNGDKKFGTPATVNPIQGGGGGGIPGAGGGAPAAAGGGAAGYAAAAKNLTDVMHGTMSGGYAATNQAMQMQNGGGGGGFGGYGGQGGEPMRGMDLRQFLPGGKNDPTRKLAGGNSLGGSSAAGIQAQSVNIWNRISERIKNRCAQGLLRDCIP